MKPCALQNVFAKCLLGSGHWSLSQCRLHTLVAALCRVEVLTASLWLFPSSSEYFHFPQTFFCVQTFSLGEVYFHLQPCSKYKTNYISLQCIFSFTEAHYSSFNMISYGSCSHHMCVFNLCIFWNRSGTFFTSSLRFWFHRLQWKRSRNTWKMQCLCFWSASTVKNKNAKHVKSALGKRINHNLHRCDPSLREILGLEMRKYRNQENVFLFRWNIFLLGW